MSTLIDGLKELIEERDYWLTVELPTDYTHAAIDERSRIQRRRSDAESQLERATAKEIESCIAQVDDEWATKFRSVDMVNGRLLVRVGQNPVITYEIIVKQVDTGASRSTSKPTLAKRDQTR